MLNVENQSISFVIYGFFNGRFFYIPILGNWIKPMCGGRIYHSLTQELTSLPTSLATNFAGSKMFGKHRKNAAARRSG